MTNEGKIKALFEPYFNKNCKEKVDKKLDENKGELIKHFHLWKGDYIFPYSSSKEIENENVSRFKFVYIDLNDGGSGEKDLMLELINQGVVRVLDENDIRSIEAEYCEFAKEINSTCDGSAKNVSKIISKDIDKLIKKIKNRKNLHYCERYYIYKAWLKKFLANEEICFLKCSPSPEVNVRIHNYQWENPNNSNCAKNIYFLHSGERNKIDQNIILDYRSHGWMRENIFKNEDFGFYDIQGELDNVKNHPISEEFIEVLLTKICIIDDRVNNRIDSEKKKQYKNLLNLEISEELDVKNKTKDLNKWKKIKEKICNKKYNFLIIHLSYIESLGFSEDQINMFFENELNFKNSNIPENFYIVITTGRGRSMWFECLDKKYKKITLFKPIETILDAVEQAVNFKDDIQLKYNLSKVIYGS